LNLKPQTFKTGVVKLVDIPDLGSGAARHDLKNRVVEIMTRGGEIDGYVPSRGTVEQNPNLFD
jgi:hypothetical protein